MKNDQHRVSMFPIRFLHEHHTLIWSTEATFIFLGLRIPILADHLGPEMFPAIFFNDCCCTHFYCTYIMHYINNAVAVVIEKLIIHESQQSWSSMLHWCVMGHAALSWRMAVLGKCELVPWGEGSSVDLAHLLVWYVGFLMMSRDFRHIIFFNHSMCDFQLAMPHRIFQLSLKSLVFDTLYYSKIFQFS